MHAPDDIVREFRLNGSLARTGIVCLPFYLGWLGLTVYVCMSNAIAFRGALLLLSLPALMSLGCCWLILLGQRYRLTIADGIVTERGVYFGWQIDLRDVVSAQWRFRSSLGSLRLDTPRTRVAIGFSTIERDDARWLIRFFRESLPPEIQQNWVMFAHRIAEPLFAEAANPRSRRRWAPRWTALLAVVALVVVLLEVFVRHSLVMAVFVIMAVTIILVVRESEPSPNSFWKNVRRGFTGHQKYLSIAYNLVVVLGMFATWYVLREPLADHRWGKAIILAVGIVLALCFGVPLHLHQRRIQIAEAEQAAESWKSLGPWPPRSPEA